MPEKPNETVQVESIEEAIKVLQRLFLQGFTEIYARHEDGSRLVRLQLDRPRAVVVHNTGQ